MEDEILEIIDIQEREEVYGGAKKPLEKEEGSLRREVFDQAYKLLDSCGICK